MQGLQGTVTESQDQDSSEILASNSFDDLDYPNDPLTGFDQEPDAFTEEE